MKILLVDDHALFREGLVELLKGLDPTAVTLQAGDAQAAIQHARAHGDIDIVLLDLYMPGLSGFDLLSTLKEALPTVPVVVLSSDETRRAVLTALDKGAVGYIPKSSTSKIMTQALRLVLAGASTSPRWCCSPARSDPRKMPDGRSPTVARTSASLRDRWMFCAAC